MSQNSLSETQCFEKYKALIKRLKDSPQSWHQKLIDYDGGEQVIDFSPREKGELAMAITSWLKTFGIGNYNWKLNRVLTLILNQKVLLTHNEIIELISWTIQQEHNYQRDLSQIIKVVGNYLKQNSLTNELEKKILELAEVATNSYNTAEIRKHIFKLREFVNSPATLRNPLVLGESWTDVATNEIESLSIEKKLIWIQIIHECQNTSGGQPTAKWLKTVQPLVEKIRYESFRASLLKWFPLVDKPRTERIESWSEWMPDPNQLINDVNADILKGLVWLCAGREDKEMARALTALAVSAYRKVPMIGPRCVRVGNACVWALGAMPGTDAVGQLALLKLKVKFGTAQKGIEKALNIAANRIGLPAEELEEMSVPTYGLTEVGKAAEQFGDFTAELVVTGTASAELRWLKSDGKPQKSVPAFVKEKHSEELKELNNAVKDIKKMLPAQRDRIENLYLEQKQWQFPAWRERYLEHPLVGTLARRLIWQFTKGDKKEAAIWLDGKFWTSDERRVMWIDDETTVELWHPLFSETAEVLEWREFLQEKEIRQPFKQAHREIYLLTDAERNTRVYSNRFAAHIIKQHQFNTLCSVRGWKNALRLMVDAEYAPPTRYLPKWNMRAEFWVESIGHDYGRDTTETGTYLYLATDQVRFYPTNARGNYIHAGGGNYRSGNVWGNDGEALDPLLLEEIPPLVFSEIMRDVDLFVGVASIGNDPTWLDGGREGHQDYWYSYSFGDLTESAKMRGELLRKLVPRLKIADKCEVTDKFLTVRGELRTYKIHLGSGNILMMPNDQYLCIVPSSIGDSFGGKVFLPFEGDRTLAIILSKAFMLAEDTKITDTTITRQIKMV
jgi:hypothetical protein